MKGKNGPRQCPCRRTLYNTKIIVAHFLTSTANYVNAPQRDVSAVGGGGSIFRFMATNPGPWFFHWFVQRYFATAIAELTSFITIPSRANSHIGEDLEMMFCP